MFMYIYTYIYIYIYILDILDRGATLTDHHRHRMSS